MKIPPRLFQDSIELAKMIWWFFWMQIGSKILQFLFIFIVWNSNLTAAIVDFFKLRKTCSSTHVFEFQKFNRILLWDKSSNKIRYINGCLKNKYFWFLSCHLEFQTLACIALLHYCTIALNWFPGHKKCFFFGKTEYVINGDLDYLGYRKIIYKLCLGTHHLWQSNDGRVQTRGRPGVRLVRVGRDGASTRVSCLHRPSLLILDWFEKN